MLGTNRRRDLPLGMALRGYYTSDRHDDPFIESHLDIRDAEGNIVPGYGWIFPMGDGRVNVGVGLLSTDRRWKGVNTSHLMETFVDFAPEVMGPQPRDLSRSPRPGASSPWASRSGPGRAPTSFWPATPPGPSTRSTARASPTATRPVAWPPPHSDTRSAVKGRRPSLEYDLQLQAAYGPYYKVARAFVRMISNPDTMKLCVGHRHALRAPDVPVAADHGQPHAARCRRAGGDRLPGHGAHLAAALRRGRRRRVLPPDAADFSPRLSRSRP